MRKSGLEVIDHIPWGTHLYLLYETRNDLLEAVVSYLRAGLENNEMCILVTSPDVGQDQAMAALAQAMPGVETYLQAHQLELVTHSQVYLKEKRFDQEHAIRLWQYRLEEALRLGFDGLRITADVDWLDAEDWSKLVAYEVGVSDTIGDSPALALCAYPLARCSINDILDIMQGHHAGVVRRGKTWHVFGDIAAQRRLAEQLREREAYIAGLLHTVSVGIAVVALDGTQLLVNDSLCRMTGFSRRELEGRRPPFSYWDPDGLETIERTFRETLAGAALGKSLELPFRRKDGQNFIAQVEVSEFRDAQGQRIAFSATVQDITERRQIQAELRQHNEELASLLEASRAAVSSLDIDRVLSAIMGHMRRVIPTAEVQAIALYDAKDGLLKTKLASGLELGIAPMEIRPGEALAGRAFLTGEARLYATPQEVAEGHASLSAENLALFLKRTRGKRPNSSIAVPLKSGDRVLGSLVLHSFSQGAFTIHDLKLAQAFANDAAIAINNAMLHEELTSLLEAAQDITSSLDVDRVLGTIMDHVRNIIPAGEAQAIALYDERDGLLKTSYAVGYEPGVMSLLAMRPGEGVTGRTFETGEARLYATLQEMAEALTGLSPENRALFLRATGGRQPNSTIAVPLKSDDKVLGCMLLHDFGRHAFTVHELKLAQAFAGIVSIAISNALLHEDMERRALTDGLTGLYNRAHFYERLRQEITRHSRSNQPLCLAMLDMNNLKIYNDTHGHMAGDRALQAIGKALRAAVRQSDIAFRYGGDEFCLILVNTSAETASGVVDRVKSQVSLELAASGIENAVRLSLSAGVAVFSPGRWNETELVEAADKALYRSKASGGTTVIWGQQQSNGSKQFFMLPS